MNDTDSDLKAEVSRLEVWAALGGGAVIVGLMAEVVLAWEYPHGDTFVERWGTVLADAIVALGVSAEVLFGWMSLRRAEELQRRSEERVAEANARAAEARLETERLKERMASRALTPEQQQAMANELSAFKGQRVYLVAAPSTSETELFMRLLAHVFDLAGWEIVGTNSLPKPLLIIPTGVIVQWFVQDGQRAWSSPDAKPAFTACQVLNKAGITAAAVGGPMHSMGAITVIINTKE